MCAQRTIGSELFAVNQNNLPQFYAWIPRIKSPVTKSTGWKLAYRLKRQYGGHWIWAEERIVTDIKVSEDQMQGHLRKLWESPSGDFKQVLSIDLDTEWQPSTLTKAEFISGGQIGDHHWAIKTALEKYQRKIPKAQIERDYFTRGWDMSGTPVISISINSTIASTIDFPGWCRKLRGQNRQRVLGLFVRDTTSDMTGEIVEVVGTLQGHRNRLTALTSRSKMRKIIENAPDTDLVVKIAAGNSTYDYITSVLQIIVRTTDYERLKIDGKQALNNLQLPPQLRSDMVQDIANILGAHGLIYDTPLTNVVEPERFANAQTLGFTPSVKLGDEHVCQADARTILSQLRRHPVVQRAPEFTDNNPIRIGVLNLIGGDERIRDILGRLQKELAKIDFAIEFTSAERPGKDSQYEMEKSIRKLIAENVHAIMTFVPGHPSDEEDDQDNTYINLKRFMVAQDVQSQFVYESTLSKDYAVPNIVLGILAKTGNVPYNLSKPLEYADVVAGIDVARAATERRSGSISIPAVSRIYTAEGDFLRYILSQAPVEGETLSKTILRQLFPAELFADKSVLVHRDGPYRGDEMEHLYTWGNEIGSNFCLVEVIKSGVPRLYSIGQTIGQPNKGDAVLLNDREALIVSSLPPHKKSTPRPLLIRSDGKIGISQALHSVLALTLMHYGSSLQPRLPVTIHYSDRIGYLALRGVTPSKSIGSKPYWI